MLTDNEVQDKTIEAHLARWQDLARCVGATNEKLAEHAICQLYLIVKRKPPRQIIWCDSPLQIATLPVLVTTIVQSATWQQICTRMQALKAGTPQWEAQWQQEWYRLRETEINNLLPVTLCRADLLNIGSGMVERALAQLKNCLHEGLAAGTLPHGCLSAKEHPDPVQNLPLSVSLDQEIMKHVYKLHCAIERLAGLDIGPSSQTLSSIFFGAPDSRLIPLLIPAAKTLVMPKHSQDIKNTINRIKARCLPIEQPQMPIWLMRLPARRTMFPELPQLNGNVEAPFLTRAILTVKQSWKLIQDEQERIIRQPVYPALPWIFWLPSSFQLLRFALACRIAYPNLFKDIDDSIDCWALLTHAAAGYHFGPEIVFACRKPISLQLNDNGLVHNESGPAAVWTDGYAVYAWRNIMIEADLIAKKDAITCASIAAEKNAERRRILIDIYGEARYLIDAGATLIHKDECGELYSLAMQRDEPICMVKVQNSTPEPDGSYKDYFLRVPPHMTQAKQAVAWTFGLKSTEYNPQYQS